MKIGAGAGDDDMMKDKATAPVTNTDTTIEQTLTFTPRFSPEGLMPAIVTDARTGTVLMFAHMNSEALRKTIETGLAHFWSRSRAKLWLKGEESGNLLKVGEIRTDCDQDVLWLAVEVGGKGVACHTGARSCFYRRLAKAPAGGTVLEVAAMPREESSNGQS